MLGSGSGIGEMGLGDAAGVEAAEVGWEVANDDEKRRREEAPFCNVSR